MKSNNSTNSVYTYRGKDLQGSIITGKISSSSISCAKDELQNRGIILLRIKKINLFFHRPKISRQIISNFTNQLANLLAAQLPIISALNLIINENLHYEFQAMLLKIRDQILQGISLAESLGLYPHLFDKFYRNFIAIGEQSGNLAEILTYLGSLLQENLEQQQKLKQALFYPFLISFIALLIFLALMLFVIPEFAKIFSCFNTPLPWYTQQMFRLSSIVLLLSPQILVLILMLILVFKKFKFPYSLKIKIDKFIFKIPIYGKIVYYSQLLKFIQVILAMLNSGISFSFGLPILAESFSNLIFKRCILQINNDLKIGSNLNSALLHTKIFPALILQLVAIGEETGKLESMLQKLSSFYKNELSKNLATFNQLLEPLVITILGILIGGIILALYLPIFKLGSAI